MGSPAALAEPESFKAVAAALARLQGCEEGILGSSTLHLFWDLFGIFGGKGVMVFWDAGIYPVARWGVERAAGRGAISQMFAHYSPKALRRLLDSCQRGTRPIILTDGFCPACGRIAPVNDYLSCARDYGGLLVIDDTQALGIFGRSPGPAAPYGRGGGGVLRWSGVNGPDVVVVASLAKGFGAPLAVLSGSSAMIGRFEERSETRVHCSPPSVAAVHAAQRALAINRQRGDALRLRLADLVKRFRQGAARSGFNATAGLFPMQTLSGMSVAEGTILHERLTDNGVKTVLQQSRNGPGAALTFILTALHQPLMVDQALAALRRATC
ncbi:aminotransferase class I/II-fold pyridoxal phosphate-dependent enzyme [Geotalea sp. SG265]|uniref:aminotransferase class I/II-fold pyridoxal phosphate-dependent enzyme n=1 Tax=Geotalea sp. SG265 TaxID=2922867 RepID=UPI001FAFC7FD|nr:aminotransferase class I/II-fold pyridoxal phosphate-dependent enzyme [Geotalea sp. SG265]